MARWSELEEARAVMSQVIQSGIAAIRECVASCLARTHVVEDDTDAEDPE
jgi:hypothetical protein